MATTGAMDPAALLTQEEFVELKLHELGSTLAQVRINAEALTAGLSMPLLLVVTICMDTLPCPKVMDAAWALADTSGENI